MSDSEEVVLEGDGEEPSAKQRAEALEELRDECREEGVVAQIPQSHNDNIPPGYDSEGNFMGRFDNPIVLPSDNY